MRIKIPTLAGLLAKYLLYIPFSTFIIMCFLLALLNPDDATKGIWIFSAYFATWWIFAFIDMIQIIPRVYLRKNRAQEVAAFIDPASYTVTNDRPAESPTFHSLDEGGGNRPYFQVTSKDWVFTDQEFDIQTHTKTGSFVSSRTYYSMLRIPLPRTLPHIVLDSKRMKGRQMRFGFDRNQKISLEGNFDQYFDTYFPASYEIDLLSIITPEIMEVLIQASEFDIEIYGKSLILYSPMLPAKQIPSAIQRATLIRDKLMNNIVTYSDQRLGGYDRKSVHIYGLTIQDNFRLKSLTTAATGLFAIALSIILVLPDSADDAAESIKKYLLFITFLVIGIALMISAISILRKGYKERANRQTAATIQPPKRSKDR